MNPLPNLSVLEFAGNDARQFLHNQLSSDVNALPVGAAGFSCCCNPAGRVIALMLLVPRADSVLAVCASELAGPLQAWLARFIFRDKVTITQREDLAVCGWSEDLVKPDLVIASTMTGLDYALVEQQEMINTGESEPAIWKARELEAGICWLDESSSAKFLPQMLDFESIGALSFKKGCFPGQEVIARTRYLGSLKRRALHVCIRHCRNFPTMQKIDVLTKSGSFSAVVADSVVTKNDETRLLLVVRESGALVPVALRLDEEIFDVT